MNSIIGIYKKIQDFNIKSNFNDKDFYKKIHKRTFYLIFLFIISALITYLIFKNNSDYVHNMLVSLSSKTKSKITPLQEFINLFLNNFRVTIFAIVVGIIPLLFLSIFIPIFNGYILGIIAIGIRLANKNIFLGLLSGYIPHSIFEIPALLYAASLGIEITKIISISNPNKKIELKCIALRIIKSYVYVLIPLLMVASLIESYITPYLWRIVGL